MTTRPHVERGKERRNYGGVTWKNLRIASKDRRQPAEGVTSRALIESLCESAIGLNQGWSRTNAEWLRDLALRGLQGPSEKRGGGTLDTVIGGDDGSGPRTRREIP
jgi:hypothetical protein